MAGDVPDWSEYSAASELGMLGIYIFKPFTLVHLCKLSGYIYVNENLVYHKLSGNSFHCFETEKD